MAFGRDETRRALADHRTAPIGDRLRAMLDFVEKVTSMPEATTAADASAVLATGVSREAFIDALYVMFLFSIYDRLADALGWQIPPEGGFRAGARKLLSRRGYL